MKSIAEKLGSMEVWQLKFVKEWLQNANELLLKTVNYLVPQQPHCLLAFSCVIC